MFPRRLRGRRSLPPFGPGGRHSQIRVRFWSIARPVQRHSRPSESWAGTLDFVRPTGPSSFLPYAAPITDYDFAVEQFKRYSRPRILPGVPFHVCNRGSPAGYFSPPGYPPSVIPVSRAPRSAGTRSRPSRRRRRLWKPRTPTQKGHPSISGFPGTGCSPSYIR